MRAVYCSPFPTIQFIQFYFFSPYASSELFLGLFFISKKVFFCVCLFLGIQKAASFSLEFHKGRICRSHGELKFSSFTSFNEACNLCCLKSKMILGFWTGYAYWSLGEPGGCFLLMRPAGV